MEHTSTTSSTTVTIDRKSPLPTNLFLVYSFNNYACNLVHLTISLLCIFIDLLICVRSRLTSLVTRLAPPVLKLTSYFG
jgi:hypothetical protein